MKPLKLYRNLVLVAAADVALLTLALFLSYLLRFDFNIPPAFQAALIRALPIILVCKLLSFHYFDLYRGMWRYTSIADLLNLLKAVSASSMIIVTVLLLGTRFIGFPRSVFVMDWCLSILLVGGFRLGIRVVMERLSEGGTKASLVAILRVAFSTDRAGRKNLLIVGAGSGGEKIYREISANAALPFRVVGFLDDDPGKLGKKIHGVPVLGGVDALSEAPVRLQADEVLIAIPSASAQQMRRIVDLCKSSGLPFKTIPGYGELIDGRISVNSIREVAYRDLLGRDVIRLEEDRIAACLKGGCVLVTGAGGSIGSELCRQICRFDPKRIVLFERAESPLYEIDLDLRRNFPHIQVVGVLGDILDQALLDDVFQRHRPQNVFHAAAYKHVPMLELQPWQAVLNNIGGTAQVVAAAGRGGAERFVFVSTDKAVRPANVMGASKRVAEMLVQCQKNQASTGTKFMIVRFGNVVGSVGSVVPLFKKQIERGGPVTVTHPEVTRYFMTIPEACQLILQAGSMGEGNEIFILDMGTPIKIVDMARDLIRLSGYEPEVDIKIEYIGLRPGEKLYEELITEGEGILPTGHEKIMVLQGNACDLGALRRQIEALIALARKQDDEGIRVILHEVVPEYLRPSVN